MDTYLKAGFRPAKNIDVVIIDASLGGIVPDQTTQYSCEKPGRYDPIVIDLEDLVRLAPRNDTENDGQC